MLRCGIYGSSSTAEKALCVPVVPLLTLLGSCPLGLSYSPADFLLDWEKPVSCQDFWRGTETTVHFPDATLSVCWPCLEHGECFLPVPALVFGWVMAMVRMTL